MHRVGCSAIGCVLFAFLANSAPISYASFPGTVINFDTLSGSPVLGAGEILSTQFASQGVTFTVPNFNAFATSGVLARDSSLTSQPNVIWVDQGGGHGGTLAQGLQIEFSRLQSRVGLYIEGSSNSFSTSTFTLAVYSGSTLLDSLTSGLAPGGAGLQGYLALQDPGITRATVFSTRSDGQNWNFEIDNLKFSSTVGVSTPEPASILSVCSGAGFIALMIRRKRVRLTR